MLNYTPLPLDLLFQALADPTRRGIVDRLSRAPATVGELATPLDMSLSAVMQHLDVLEASGIVRSRKVGRVRTCRLHHRALRPIEQWIASRQRDWNRDLDRLEAMLAAEDTESGPTPPKPPTPSTRKRKP